MVVNVIYYLLNFCRVSNIGAVDDLSCSKNNVSVHYFVLGWI